MALRSNSTHRPLGTVQPFTTTFGSDAIVHFERPFPILGTKKQIKHHIWFFFYYKSKKLFYNT